MTGETDNPAEIEADDVVTRRTPGGGMEIMHDGAWKPVPHYAADLIERQAAEIARLRDPWRLIDDEARNGDLWLLRHRDGRRSAGRYIEHIDVFSVVGGEHWTADRVTECAPLPTPTADKEG